MKLYLAGPMRGYEKSNFPAFDAAAARLREAGHEVFNPADMAAGQPLREYMKVDLAAVLDAERVVFLDGWHESVGACLEMMVARICNVPLYGYIDNEEIEHLLYRLDERRAAQDAMWNLTKYA